MFSGNIGDKNKRVNDFVEMNFGAEPVRGNLLSELGLPYQKSLEERFWTEKKESNMFSDVQSQFTAEQIRHQLTSGNQLSVAQIQFLEDNNLDLEVLQQSANKIDWRTEEKRDDKKDQDEYDEPMMEESLVNYPDLEDLQTSNMFSRKFMGEQATRLAHNSLDQTKISQFIRLKE